MLKHIPFYASLLNRPMAEGKKASNGLVLVYGAVEVHAMGYKGCIASNKRIAEETGLTAGTVANYISFMNKSGWLQVVLNGDKSSRLEIIPLLTIATPSPVDDTLHRQVKPPSSHDEPPLHPTMNIEDNRDNSEVTTRGLAPSDEISKLYFEVIKSLGVPVRNHNNVISAISKMKKEADKLTLVAYLKFMRDKWKRVSFDFKPDINEALDIHAKRLQITNALQRTKKQQSTKGAIVL